MCVDVYIVNSLYMYKYTIGLDVFSQVRRLYSVGGGFSRSRTADRDDLKIDF